MMHRYKNIIMRHVFNFTKLETLTYDDQIGLLIFLIRLSGYCRFKKSKRDISDTLPSIGAISYLLLFIVFGLVFVYNNSEDLYNVTECLMTTFLGFGVLCKLLILVIFSKRINKLLEELETVHDSVKSEGGIYWCIMMKRMKEARIVTRTIFYACICVGICFVCITIPYMKNFRMMLPAGVVGVPIDTVSGYIVNFIWHFTGMIITTNVMTGFNGLIVYVVLTICGQIEILHEKLMNISTTSENGNADSENSWTLNHDCIKKNLRDCLILHQWILNVSSNMNHIYKFDCFIEVTCSTLVGCFSLFQITEPSDVPLQFYAYVISCVLQIFVYCWYGDLIMRKSIEINRVIYLCPWYRLDISQQRMLCIMMMKAQNPIKLSAIFVDIDLSIFTAVMKTTYSYYTVLSSSD